MEMIDVRINVPFVLRQSKYLEEVTYEYNPLLGQKYLEALLKEIISGASDFEDYEISSITFDGYPDILGGSQYKKIIQAFRKYYHLADNLDITFPVSVDNVSQASFVEIISAKMSHPIIKYGTGIEKEHNLLERPFIYTAFSAMEFLLKSLPLPTSDIEVYYGLNGSTTKDLYRNLDGALSINPARIYFKRVSMNDKPDVLTDEEVEKQFFAMKEYLGSKGYVLQNGYYFSKEKEDFQKLHECVGFGLGEETYLEGISYRNTFNLEKYLGNSDNLDIIASKPILLDEESEKKRNFLYELLFNNRILDIEVPLYQELTDKGYLEDNHLSSKGIINIEEIMKA